MNNAAACGMCHRIGAAGGVELVQDRADMKFGGVDGDAELPGDGLVGGAFGHQRQHVELTRGQLDVGPVAITRPLARYDGEIGGLPWRGEDDTGDAAQQRGKPVCQRRIVDLDRYPDDWRGFLAHRSGLSPIVSLKFTGSSARRTATSMTEPTLSGPSARRSARTPESFSL